MKPLEDYLKPTQKELFAKLRTQYKGRTNVCKNSYILVRGRPRYFWWRTLTLFTPSQ